MLALPPLAAIRPAMLNGTMPVYCHDVSSTKPSAGFELVALNVAQEPLASLGCIMPLLVLNVLRQSCARCAYSVRSAVSPCVPANADNAKSALSYSRLVDTGP